MRTPEDGSFWRLRRFRLVISDSELIIRCISQGINTLVSNLRTHRVFPVESNSAQIARTAMELYPSPGGCEAEFLFDDLDDLTA